MGWEWRVFFPLDSDTSPDLWSLLSAHASGSSPERRTDLYVRCVDGAGLKVRGGRLLEVKLRSTREANGAEHWKKVGYSSSYRQISL